MGRRGWIWAGAGALVVAAVLGGAWQKVNSKPASGQDKPVPPLEFRPAEVVRPVMATLPRRVEFSGALVAPDSAVVRAKAAGTLVQLAVGEGDRVKAGQVIGRVDLADLATRAAERGANLEAARATLAQAERTHASNERLAAQNFISTSALDASRSQLDAARSQVAAAQASLDTARVALRESTLVAPIAGIVARRQAVAGEKLAAEQPVVAIVNLARLELAGQVPTHEVPLLAPGMPVAVQVEGLPQPVAGRLDRIAPSAEPGSRAIAVTVSVDNAGERLRGGLYAVARVALADAQPRLTLPIGAVGNTAGEDHVWTITNGALLRRTLTLGRRDEASGRVEVLQGLTPQDVVLAARFDNLREGAKAQVVAAATPAASAAAAR